MTVDASAVGLPTDGISSSMIPENAKSSWLGLMLNPSVPAAEAEAEAAATSNANYNLFSGNDVINTSLTNLTTLSIGNGVEASIPADSVASQETSLQATAGVADLTTLAIYMNQFAGVLSNGGSTIQSGAS